VAGCIAGRMPAYLRDGPLGPDRYVAFDVGRSVAAHAERGFAGLPGTCDGDDGKATCKLEQAWGQCSRDHEPMVGLWCYLSMRLTISPDPRFPTDVIA
jgi:hypothetical protein